MTDPILNKPADIKTLRKLYQEGLLSEEAFKVASEIIRPNVNWFVWAKKTLLLVGCALILSGVIFFFAYNWAEMGKFLKFGLIEVGIMTCLIVSYLKDNKSLTSKILLLSASILVGVLLAVYGQTYQTGADAFGLFLGWAGLIFGWVLISDFAALWLIWLILVNTGAILYWQQVGYPSYAIPYEFLCICLAFLNAIALALREWGVQKQWEWLNGIWLRIVLVISVFTYLSIPTIDQIIAIRYREEVSSFVGFVWLIVAVGGYYCYRNILRDMVPISIIVMNACVILLTLFGKALFSSSSDVIGLFLFFALVIVGVVTGAVFLLKYIAKTMATETKDLPQ